MSRPAGLTLLFRHTALGLQMRAVVESPRLLRLQGVDTDRVAVVGMDGEMGGRLTWGVIRSLGLSGLRVPTLLLATPAPDPAAAEAAIQRVLDASNARYKAAFILQPVPAPSATLWPPLCSCISERQPSRSSVSPI